MCVPCQDHVTSEEALSLAWTGNNTLIVGYLHQYMVMNAETGDARRIFDTRHTMASSGFEPRSVHARAALPASLYWPSADR